MPTSAEANKHVISGMLLTAALVLLYCLFWWNQALGLSTEGWFYFYAQQFQSGLFPYRDFYLFSTPGHLFESVFLREWVGHEVIFGRLAGLIQRVLMGGVLFLWLRRAFGTSHALAGAVVAMAVYTNDTPDVLFYINHSAMFWFLLSSLCISSALRRPAPGWVALGGACAFLSFFMKQSLGAGAGVLGALMLLLPVLRGGGGAALGRTLVYVAAWWVPAGLFVWFLCQSGGWESFCDQIFGAGTGSKGGLREILLRPFEWPTGALMGLCGLVIALLMRRVDFREVLEAELTTAPALRAGWIAAGLFVSWGVGAVVYHYGGQAGQVIRTIHFLLMLMGIALAFVVLLKLGARYFREGWTPHEWQWAHLAAGAVTVWFFVGLSFSLYEPMAIPAVGLLIAWICSRLDRGSPRAIRLLGALLPVALAGACLFYKCMHPFYFFGMEEPPVYAARGNTEHPLLRGYRLSAETAGAIDELTALAAAHTRPGDTVFVYPHLPLIYTLVDRRPPTSAYVHWFDVAPDAVVRADIAALRENPPGMILFQNMSLEEAETFERMFRGGRPSAQRDMIRYLNSLQPEYRKVGEWKINTYSRPLEIWVKDASRL